MIRHVLALVFAFLAGTRAFAANELPNGNFARGDANWTLFFPESALAASPRFSIDPAAGHEGSPAAVLRADEPARFALQSDVLELQPGARYELSGWVKADAASRMKPRSPGVLIRATFFTDGKKALDAEHLHVGPGDRVAKVAQIGSLNRDDLPKEWTRLRIAFATPAEARRLQVALFLWSATGPVAWSDIRLEKIDAGAKLSAVETDASAAPAKAVAQNGPAATEPAVGPAALATDVSRWDGRIPEQTAWVASHPRVVLDAAKLAELRRKITEPGVPAEAWARLVKLCDRYIDKNDSQYRDPAIAFEDYLALVGGSHEARTKLEVTLRRWTTPTELLAFAHTVSGRAEYGRAAAELALAGARRVNADTMGAGFFLTRSFQVRAQTLALDWCYASFNEPERQELRLSLGHHINRLYWGSMNGVWGQTSLGRIWNWNAGSAAAWGLASLVLDGEVDFPTRPWLFQATRNLEDFLDFGVDAAGGPIEGPVYLSYGAGATPYFIEALKAATGEDLHDATHLRYVMNWLRWEILPGGGRVNNLMDSDHAVRVADTLSHARARARSPEADWAWAQIFRAGGILTLGEESLPGVVLWGPSEAELKAARAPASSPLSALAPGRGLAVSRSSWADDAAMFTVHAQRYTEFKHDQADKGQFTLYAYGDDHAVDSGYGNDSKKDRSSSAYAHSLVMVDGEPQLQGGSHARTDGWITRWLPTEVADLTRVDQKDAYEFSYASNFANATYRKQRVREFVRAERTTLFVRGPLPYAVVLDDIQRDEQPHLYTWTMHSAAGNMVARDGAMLRVAGRDEAGPVVATQPARSQGSGDAPLDFDAAKLGRWTARAQIPAGGRYVVWGLCGSGDRLATRADSFFLTLNGGKLGQPAGASPAAFAWATSGSSNLTWVKLNDDNGSTRVPALDLKAGPLELALYGREEGAWLAAICLQPEAITSTPDLDKPAAGAVFVRAEEGKARAPLVLKPADIRRGSQNSALELHVLHPAKFADSVEPFQTTRSGTHPRIKLDAQAVRPRFLNILLPVPNDARGQARPRVERGADGDSASGLVRWPDGVIDWIAAGPADGPQGLRVNADFFWARLSASGELRTFSGSRVARVERLGKPVIDSPAPVDLAFAGRELLVEPARLAALRHELGADVATRPAPATRDPLDQPRRGSVFQ